MGLKNSPFVKTCLSDSVFGHQTYQVLACDSSCRPFVFCSAILKAVQQFSIFCPSPGVLPNLNNQSSRTANHLGPNARRCTPYLEFIYCLANIRLVQHYGNRKPCALSMMRFWSSPPKRRRHSRHSWSAKSDTWARVGPRMSESGNAQRTRRADGVVAG